MHKIKRKREVLKKNEKISVREGEEGLNGTTAENGEQELLNS